MTRGCANDAERSEAWQATVEALAQKVKKSPENASMNPPTRNDLVFFLGLVSNESARSMSFPESNVITMSETARSTSFASAPAAARVLSSARSVLLALVVRLVRVVRVSVRTVPTGI